MIISAYIKTLPPSPGVYRMLGKGDEVLYVGKAKNLKKRVTSYTQTERLPLRLRRMVAETTHMAFVVTETEAEALLLEANLIKKLKPRYNIQMRDSKSFAYLWITAGHPYPLLTKYRGSRNEPGDYFGPFASTTAVNQTLTTLHKAFRLRSCSDAVFGARKRPCLQYQIKRCSAPCVGYISQENYQESVQEARDFLSGKSHEVQKKLALAMEEASTCRNYEQAALYRDRIRSITAIQAHQSVHLASLKDADVFAIMRVEGVTCIQLFLFRSGANYGTHATFPFHGEDVPLEDVLEAYMAYFYQEGVPPQEILLSHSLPSLSLMEEALTIRAGHRVRITVPKLGPKADLMRQALTNARQSLERHQAERASQEALLQGVQETFDLPIPLNRIEVYDNSHIQGAHPIGAMIVAGAEGFIKKAYRKFNIRANDITPGDDYGMLAEVLSRRFGKSAEHDEDAKESWPSLLLIDGGKGQLNRAEKVLADLGIFDIPVVAISKGPDRNAGRETFHRTGKPPLQLPPTHKVLYYLQRLRDEAHRFAIGAHRTKRTQSLSTSRLDDIPGIGPGRKKALLRHFGSAKAVEGASLKDLEAVSGISRALAHHVYAHFREVSD